MEGGAAAPSAAAIAADLVDIRPLDIQGALQILVAEVRLSLVEALTDQGNVGGTNVSGDTGNPMDGPVPAARVIVDLVLRSLPATFEPASWAIALPRVDIATQAGVQRALDAVIAWRDVPAAVVEATRESATLALSLIADEQPYPLWPPDEWIGFAPRLARFWRRRRALKRRLIDPDHGASGQGRQDRMDDLDETL